MKVRTTVTRYWYNKGQEFELLEILPAVDSLPPRFRIGDEHTHDNVYGTGHGKGYEFFPCHATLVGNSDEIIEWIGHHWTVEHVAVLTAWLHESSIWERSAASPRRFFNGATKKVEVPFDPEAMMFASRMYQVLFDVTSPMPNLTIPELFTLIELDVAGADEELKPKPKPKPKPPEPGPKPPEPRFLTLSDIQATIEPATISLDPSVLEDIKELRRTVHESTIESIQQMLTQSQMLEAERAKVVKRRFVDGLLIGLVAGIVLLFALGARPYSLTNNGARVIELLEQVIHEDGK